ncbi:hypothetical protein PLESTF_000601100 [Pleodorina starrii]|nr:hypothetical protein PLESTF_000601100 [Pleodorina starrii]
MNEVSGLRIKAGGGTFQYVHDLFYLERRLRSFPRQVAPWSNCSAPADEPSGIWQAPKILSRLDPGSVAFSGELDSFSSEPDSPSLDYVLRYPPPTGDDPDDPTTTAAAAAAGLLGPDLHAPLELETEPSDAGAAGRGRGAGWRRARSLVEQLRQRALAGSSSDDEGQAGGEREWQSLVRSETGEAEDIPALLMSPHHAAALYSLSSSEEDTSAVPDFADQAVAGEADRAAQAAAELVPPELRPLARAANLLGFHTQLQRLQGHRRPGPGLGLGLGGESSSSSGSSGSSQAAGSDAPEPDLHLMEANRFSGLCEPLTEEQLEAVAMLANAAATAAIAATAAAAMGNCRSGADNPAATASASEPPPPPAAAAAAAATVKMTAAAAAAAAALAEEGLEWLDAARPAAAGPAPQRLDDAKEDVAVSMDLEERSVQLRRPPCKTASELGLDEDSRERVAAEAAHELAEAEAHVVGHHGGGAAAAGSAAPTHGSVGRFVELKLAAARPVGAGGGEEGAAAAAAAAVEGVAAAGGREAADAAAASVAAEARRAVWGEAGWPYGAAMRTTDLVEELKHSIHQQQEEAERGAPGTLLP